jgi:cell division protein FtsI (penicillin-binding protein 3)
VVLRLAYVQTVGAHQYVAYGEEQRIEPISLPAARGTIFDRNGKDLALSTPAKSVGADPSVIRDRTAAARSLARVLRIPGHEVASKLATDTHFVYLARQVEDDVAERVEKLDIPGVLIFDESARLLPAGDMARSLIGSVDLDNVGVAGLELRYDDQLAGDPGEYMVERDLEGRTIPGGRHLIDPAEPGDDIVLTIDRSLQYATEGILAEQVRTTGAKAGWAAVMDPRSGEVMALANVETDPKAHVVSNTGNNLAVTQNFEPGSVNKVITMAGALEDGLVASDTELQVPDTLHVADHVYTDAHSLPPRMTASQILSRSSNIGTIEIAQRLGMPRLDEYLRRFGFGQPTALGLPHEEPGILLDPDNWSGTSIGSIPIGQGISVTAMQMLLAYNTIANDGVYVPPTLLRATFDAEGERHPAVPAEGRRVVSPTTAAQVREMLAQAVTSGTGRAAGRPGQLPLRRQLRGVHPRRRSPGVDHHRDRRADHVGVRQRRRRARLRQHRPPSASDHADRAARGRGGDRHAAAAGGADGAGPARPAANHHDDRDHHDDRPGRDPGDGAAGIADDADDGGGTAGDDDHSARCRPRRLGG